MYVASRHRSSPASSSSYLTSPCSADVIRHGDVTSPTDMAVWRRSQETSNVAFRNTTAPPRDVNTPALTTVATEPPRCLHNGSNITSSAAIRQELTQLSTVGTTRENDVGNVSDDQHFADGDVTRQQFPVGRYSDVIVEGDSGQHHVDTQMMPTTGHLPASEDVETYDTFDARHRVCYQHQQHQQQVYCERRPSSQVSFSSTSTSDVDVKPQFHRSLYNLPVEHRHRNVIQPLQPDVVDYEPSCSTLPTGPDSDHVTGYSSTAVETADACRPTLVSMFYGPSSLSSLVGDSEVSGSFSALLRSSPFTHHLDPATRYDAERADVADERLRLVDTTLLPYYNGVQPSSCYSDDRTPAWSSSSIVTLLNSFAGTVAECRDSSLTYCAGECQFRH